MAAGKTPARPEMLVTVRWQDRTMAVPLGQLVGVDVDESTAEAIADWHYLDEPRYRFWLA